MISSSARIDNVALINYLLDKQLDGGHCKDGGSGSHAQVDNNKTVRVEPMLDTSGQCLVYSEYYRCLHSVISKESMLTTKLPNQLISDHSLYASMILL